MKTITHRLMDLESLLGVAFLAACGLAYSYVEGGPLSLLIAPVSLGLAVYAGLQTWKLCTGGKGSQP